jgi:ETS translocation variant 6/7
MLNILFNFRFLRNPTELKSIKNISLLRQSMTNTNQQHVATSSTMPSSSSSSSVAVATAAALQASALASLLPQNSSNLHHMASALVQNSASLKMEFGVC